MSRRATRGSPILLVHGFPETWWTFHKVIPSAREITPVFAIYFPGLGDSSHADGSYDSKTTAETLHVRHRALNVGPVHISAQDFSGAVAFRFASDCTPTDVLSFTAIETSLPGFRGGEARPT